MLKKTPATALRAPLAVITGYAEQHLTLALPEFIGQRYTDTPGLIDRPLVDGHVPQRPACRFCTRRAGIDARVTCWMTHDRNICLRHLLWIGEGCSEPSDQVDLSPLPATAQAQRHHHNLINRHGRRWVSLAFADATKIFSTWKERSTFGPRETITHRLTSLTRPSGEPVAADLAFAAGFHPEIIRLSGLLASDHWERTGLRKGGLAPFVREVSRRHIIKGFDPDGLDDPLIQWLRDRANHYNMAQHLNKWDILTVLLHEETTRRLTKRLRTDLRTCPLPQPRY
ncbi:hypothetical protein [Streptomyces sp. NPDC050704]|uniref:hypothetical protein n=1 Tax=Streptomyces sp. NPDC050704 TaxID=3157219 RepID=UPI0034227FD4